MKRIITILAVLSALVCSVAFGEVDENALKNGSFETLNAKKDFPAGWGGSSKSGVRLAAENGNHFVRVTNEDPKSVINFITVLKLKPKWKRLKFSARMRTENLKVGKEGWHCARLVLRFEDARGKLIKYPSQPSIKKNSDWTVVSVVNDVPKGAARVVFQPGLYFATGVMDIDDIRVVPVDTDKPAAPPGPVSAGPVFPRGSFEKLNSSGRSAEGWSRSSRKNIELAEKDGNHWIRIKNDDPGSTVYIGAALKLNPDWYAVRVSVRMKATNLKTGKEGWHNARLVMSFKDSKGKMVGGYPKQPRLKADSDWTELSAVLDIPKGAVVLYFQPGLYFATGVMELDDIKILGMDENTVIAAKLPKDEKLYWCSEPVENISPVRGRRILNGIWKFIPAIGPAATDPKGGWGYIRVPGAWYARKWALDKVLARGAGKPWKVNFEKLDRAWYEREILVPESWKGREVVLSMGRVCTDAVVYLDGKKCGNVEWPFGEVVLTPFVTPGKKQTLRIYVVAVGSDKEAKHYLDADTVITSKAKLDGRGIVGDVLLESRPQGAHIEGVFVKTSVRKKMLGVELDLKSVKSAGPVKVTGTVTTLDGATAHGFEMSVNAAAKEAQTVKVSSAWANPKLWDFRRPNLYVLRIKVEGGGLRDEYVQRFGFREFRIEGKKFLLNEKVFNLRPTLCFPEKYVGGMREAIGGMIDGFMHANFNLLELWPWDHDMRGGVLFREFWAKVADEKGWPIMYPALSMSTYISKWNQPGQKEKWEKRMVAEWKHYRNNPSVVILVSTANRFGHRDDQNPRRLGRSNIFTSDEKWLEHARSGLEAMEIIRKYDSTRPITSHHASGVGDIHTCNHYLDFIPLQEREEWLSEWAATGDKPYMAIEFGTPFSYNLLRGRDGAHQAPHSEMLATEFCAAYLGEESYRLETKEYKNAIIKRFQKGQNYGRWQGSGWLMHEAPNQKIQSLFVRNTWRSWRAWGMSGGMIPWEYACGWTGLKGAKPFVAAPFKPGRMGVYRKSVQAQFIYGMKGGMKTLEAGKALMAGNSPTLAWIGGPSKAFTAKDHNFYPGVAVDKQIILLNDERDVLDYDVTWSVTIAGASILSGTKKSRIDVGAVEFIPLKFKTPDVSAKTEGKISVVAHIGKTEHRNEFTFRVFPKLKRAGRDVLVFDPEGETTKLIKALGYTTVAWDGRPARGKVLVVGRNALSGGKSPPGLLDKFVGAGGRAVVFAQQPEWLTEKVGLRVAPIVSRWFYPVHSLGDSPILRGLDEKDLRDWRGGGTLVPETLYTELDNNERRYKGWHWGNRGSVSSAPIEKPHRSGWRPLIEGEFDLAFTPLMELAYGDGLVVWSGLDLSGRSQRDPVAQLLGARIIEYAADVKLTPRFAKAFYIGGEKDSRIVTLLGLIHDKVEALPKAPALVVIGEGAGINDGALKKFLSAGGKALVLPRAINAGVLGFKLAEKDFDGSLEVPSWEECRGLSPSDLRLRAFIKTPLLVSGPGKIGAGGSLGRLGVGSGVAILAQVSPDMLPYTEKTYFRYSAWRVTRTLSQILANMGGTFIMDKRSLQFEGRERSPFDPISLAGLWKGKMEAGMPPASSPQNPVKDKGNKGFAKGWAALALDDSGWKDVGVPGYFDDTVDEWKNLDGAFWFRKEVIVPKSWVGKDIILLLGAVDDFDVTYFNGKKIGSVGPETPNFWTVRREYRVPAASVRAGRNVIAIRVFDHFGSGGFNATRKEIKLKVVDGPTLPDLYFPGYRADHARGDDPYRYHRW